MAVASKAEAITEVVEQVETFDDPRQALQRLRSARAAAEARGERVPEAVITLERRLTAECIAESQGR